MVIRLSPTVLALVATVRLALAQGAPDLPTPAEVAAVRAFAMIGAAGHLCPHLGVNLRHAHHLAALFRFDPADLRGRYRPLAGLVRAEFEHLAVEQPRAFCGLAWRWFGRNGLFPEVLQRR